MAELLNIHELSDRFNGITVGWIKQQCKAGNIPFLKAGRHWLFNPIAVSEALAKMAAGFPNQSAPVLEPAAGQVVSHAAR